MVTNTDIVNRALQSFGTRTTVTDSELANSTTNEAIQANLILTNTRDDLLRMAPWDCALNYANLTYITSQPGTPENTSAATTLWAKGQPPPPWGYEYQYPNDCLRALFIVPATQTGFSGAIPITTAVTGGANAFWQGPPVKFKVGIDQFIAVLSAAVSAAGTGYAVNDIITVALQPTAGTTNRIGTFLSGAPQGAAVQLLVSAVGGGGSVSTVTVLNQVGEAIAAVPRGGSYFYVNATSPATQASTTGAGTGATFTLTFDTGPSDQRVILTNQEYATLAYCRRVVNPDVMDTLFQSAWIQWLGANLCIALTGDKQLANMCISLANRDIEEARKVDGNEGLTVNDVCPDWIRVRGTNWNEYAQGPYANFDWGGYLPLF